MSHRSRTPPRLAACLLFSILACGCNPSSGQAATDASTLAEMPIEQLLGLEVQSASRFTQRLADAPSLVSIVTAEDIRAYGYRTLADILRSFRGTTVTYDRNYTYLGVRGLARPSDYNGRILLLVDGYRVNDNVYEQGSIGSEFFLPVDLIERVEFVPGPSSSVYGANAVLGVVNVITQRGANLAGLRATASVGDRQAREAMISYGRPESEGVGALFAFEAFDTKGADLYFPEFDTPQTNGGIAKGLDFDRGYRAYAKLQWEGTTLTLANSSRTKGIPTASFEQTFNAPGAQTTDASTYVTVRHQRNVAPGIELTASVDYGRYHYSGDYIYGADPVLLNRDVAEGEWVDAEAQALVTRFERQKIVVGADFRQDLRRDQKSYYLDPYANLLDDHRTGNSYGVYVEDEITLMPQLLLNAGIRHDEHATTGGSTNPRLALIYHATAQTTAKILYGTAFREPNAYELFYTSGDWKLNPDLQPERVQTTEIVVEHYLPLDTRLGLSIFRNRIRGLVELETDPVDGALHFVNRTGASARGFELDWEQHWPSGARAHASYGWQRVVDDATDVPLTNAARQLAKLNVTGPLAGWLDGGLEAQFVSRRATLAGAYAPAYVVVNATLFAKRLLPSLEISVSAYNLFDRRYADPGGVEHVQDLIVQDGRSWRLKAMYAF